MEAEATYIGSDNVDRVQFVSDIAYDIAAFKLEYSMRDRRIKVTPDDLH